MSIPLAERIRPTKLSEIMGQEHLTSDTGLLASTIRKQTPHSLLLYGPPGCGKTTMARLYAAAFPYPFLTASAVFQSVQELKKVLKEGQDLPLYHRKTILFVDEIHRFNRAQQDLFLPFLEDGSLILIGATTENPSFALNSALLSRLRALELRSLDRTALEKIAERYEALCKPLPLDPDAREMLFDLSQGDGRHLLNLIENIETCPSERIDRELLAQIVHRRLPLYDKKKEGHYNLISALHKSVRGSDPNAALYWLMRMLDGGEDPLFIARRLIRMAAEDIGLSDPQALSIAIHAREAYETLGSPEGELALAQAVLYLALSPKSNAVYTAFKEAKELASKTGQLPPPRVILNAPTAFMKERGYGEGYLYDHDAEGSFSGQDYFPEGMQRPSFYEPKEVGFEREMKKRLDYFRNLYLKRLADI